MLWCICEVYLGRGVNNADGAGKLTLRFAWITGKSADTDAVDCLATDGRATAAGVQTSVIGFGTGLFSGGRVTGPVGAGAFASVPLTQRWGVYEDVEQTDHLIEAFNDES